MKNSKFIVRILALLMVVLPILLSLFGYQQRYESNLLEARTILTEASEHIETQLSHGVGFSREESDFIIDCEISLAAHKLIDNGFLHLSSNTKRRANASVEAMRKELLSAEGARSALNRIEAVRRQLSSVDTSFAASLAQHVLWRNRCDYCAVIATMVG